MMKLLYSEAVFCRHGSNVRDAIMSLTFIHICKIGSISFIQIPKSLFVNALTLKRSLVEQ